MRSSPALLFVLSTTAFAQPFAQWKFEAPEGAVASVRDEAGGRLDEVRGNAWSVQGVSGRALQFDGITAHIVRGAGNVPGLTGAFTVEAWVAIGAYPFNWCPLAQQQNEDGKAGYFFGIGDKGQVARRKDFRIGHRSTLEGTDLIVWVRIDSSKPVTVSLTPGR